MDAAGLLEEARRTERPTLLLARDPGAPVSVALVAGSFDPPTVAHVALAEAAAERADLVVLAYSVRTLPKEGGAPPPLLTEEERVRSLARICEMRARLVAGVCSQGLLADQVAAASERFPGASLELVMGSDKALQLLDPRWYEDRDRALDDLFARARVSFAVRAGDEGRVEEALARPENSRWSARFERLDVARDVAGISSRLVRDRVATGGDVRGLVPEEIRAEIALA